MVQVSRVRNSIPRKRRVKTAINNVYPLIQDVSIIKAERCKRSLYHFIQEFWPEVSNDEFIPNWHIKYIADLLQGLAKDVAEGKPRKYDLVLNVPPGSTKTITCSIMFPVWCWINWYWMRFITASYSAALSLESAEYSRDLMRSDKFKKYFPELTIKSDKDTKSNFRVVRDGKFGGNRYSTSVGGTLTGFHGHILVVDDPISPHQAVSLVELATANRWMEQTLSTRKVDKAITPTILVMQRLHQEDPTGHILSKHKKNVFHVSLPGEIKNYKDNVKPAILVNKYKDNLLDPVRMSWSVLKDMEADLGQYGYAGQVGQNPTPPGGGMFKVEHFQVIDHMPAPTNIEKTVRYWDKAGTAGGTGAYTAGLKMHKVKGGKFIISDMKRGRWATEERERIIRETAEADGQNVLIYFEQEPGSGGKESAEATVKNLVGYSAHPDRPVGDKVFRADPFSVQVNNGNVLLLRGDWNQALIEEYRFFPFGSYKDQVDAGSGAFAQLVNKKQAGMLFSRRRNAN